MMEVWPRNSSWQNHDWKLLLLRIQRVTPIGGESQDSPSINFCATKKKNKNVLPSIILILVGL